MPEVEIPAQFKRLVDRKDKQLAAAIVECVYRLGENPRHAGLQTHHVRGTSKPKVYEAYVDKKNRVTFHWDGAKIVLRNNCNHDILRTP
jgi:hypothetical protein